MAVKLNPASYLLFSELINVDGVEFWGLVDFPQLLEQPDDIFIDIGIGKLGEIVSTDESLRIDLLSNRIYGTPHLWWALALRNGLEVVPSGFKFGETVVASSPRYIFEEILPKARG